MAGQETRGPGDDLYLSAERIKQLNGIDKDVAKLLDSAGLAVKALTKTQELPNEVGSLPAGLEGHKAAFTSAASQYFTLLSSIDVRLRRQIYALEEAEVISADPPAKESLAAPAQHGSLGEVAATMALSQAASQTTSKNASTTAGALGNLDVGWLNSRNDKVGKQMEAELWARASDFVKRLKAEKLGNDTVEEQESLNHNSDASDDLFG